MTVRHAATVQLVSGLIDTWFMAGCMWGLIGSTCGSLTESWGMVGGLWGWAACVLAPFGIVEITIALRARRDPNSGEIWVKRLAAMQIASISVGGVTACVAGLVALALLRRPA